MTPRADTTTDLRRLASNVTLLTERLNLLTRWDKQRDGGLFGDTGLHADRTTADVVASALEAARDAARAAEDLRLALLDRALTEGGVSDRSIARAAGTTANTIARRRNQRES